jgi:hypothetical protein
MSLECECRKKRSAADKFGDIGEGPIHVAYATEFRSLKHPHGERLSTVSYAGTGDASSRRVVQLSQIVDQPPAVKASPTHSPREASLLSGQRSMMRVAQASMARPAASGPSPRLNGRLLAPRPTELASQWIVAVTGRRLCAAQNIPLWRGE